MLLRASPMRVHAPASRSASSPASSMAPRRVDSRYLLEGERELVIEHQGSEYHLRLTRNDKLILTK